MRLAFLNRPTHLLLPQVPPLDQALLLLREPMIWVDQQQGLKMLQRGLQLVDLDQLQETKRRPSSMLIRLEEDEWTV